MRANERYGMSCSDSIVQQNSHRCRVVTVLMGISSLVFYILGGRAPLVSTTTAIPQP